MHAQAPALVTWDDHEVQNDYADQWSEYFDEPAQFLLRRAAAYQAFYEHMPVRPMLSRPNGPVMRVYDRFTFGDLSRSHCWTAGNTARARPATGRRTRAAGTWRPGPVAPNGSTQAHDDRFRARSLAVQRSCAHQGAMEFGRAGYADGAVPQKTKRWRRVLDRRLERLSGHPNTPARSTSATPRCPIRSWSPATSTRSSPMT